MSAPRRRAGRRPRCAGRPWGYEKAGLAALLLLAVLPAAAETVKLRAGADVAAGVKSLDERSLTLEDGRVLPRADVQEIQFALLPAAKSAAGVADPAAAARGRELFAQAAEFGKKHPGADALVLLDEGEFVYRDDGTSVARSRLAGQVLKEGAKQAWGQVTGYYEEGRERVRIVNATVYHPDGTAYPLRPELIQAAKPQGEALFFTEYRTVTYPLPQLEVGDVVEWETETETYNPFRKDFWFPRWGFQGGSPVLDSRVSVTVPKAQKLYFLARHFDGPFAAQAEPHVSADAKSTTYFWELKDVPQIVGEPLMADYFDYAPSVKAALFNDWDRVYDWLADMHKARTQPGPELERFTRELVKDCKTDDEKVATIYHYIQKDIRYIAVKMGVASGWGGYDANLTWKRRYGCCIDKALLFTAMLGVAGIESSPVLLDTNRRAERELAIPDIWFEHAITWLTVGARAFFLDSTGYDYRYPAFASMDHGSTALNVFHRRFDPIPVPPPSANRTDYDYRVALSSAGDASVRFVTTYVPGSREGEIRGYYKRIKKSERKRVFQDWVNRVSPSGTLVDYKLSNLDDISKPFSVEMDYRLPDYPIRAGDLFIFKLPDFEQDFHEVALEKRTYDMKYDTAYDKHYRYAIDLPPAFKAASLPEATTLEGPGESFTASCSVEGSALRCEADLSRAERVYKVKDYAAHKAFLEKVSRRAKDRIFLRAGDAP